MEHEVCIVHFNTPDLTRAAVQSIWKHSPGCKVTVFDNSTVKPFKPMDGVRILDNTKGQLIDFQKLLEGFPFKQPTDNNWGSAKHTCTVDFLWQYFPNGFVLMDSDAFVRKDITPLFDESVAYIGQELVEPSNILRQVRRLLPYICWINVKMCKEKGIKYFDPERSWKLKPGGPSTWYDTGASFLEDCIKAGLPGKDIDISEYIEHFDGASHDNGLRSWRAWMESNKNLYDMEENKHKTGEEYLVVIPFFKGGAQGNEIDYAIAGWRKHFKENYKIVIVGDYADVVDTGDDIVFIECQRIEEVGEGNYRPHMDFVKKFKAVRKAFPKSKGFIFVADDCYAVNDFDIYDIMPLRMRKDNLEEYMHKAGGFFKDEAKTRDWLKSEGYPTRNFTTHIPAYFEWDKLEALWERLDMEHNSYVFEDLYFNIYYPTRVPQQLNIDHDNLKCGVYRPNPRMEYIKRAFKKQIWIQNSVEGWIPALEKILKDYYKIGK